MIWNYFQGLTAEMFHSNREAILSSSKEDLPAFIDTIVSKNTSTPPAINISSPLYQPTQIPDTSHIYLALTTSPMPDVGNKKVKVITLVNSQSIGAPALSAAQELRFMIPDGRKAQIMFADEILPRAIAFERLARREGAVVVVRDEEGRDLSVGLAMVLLWEALDDDGRLRTGEVPVGGCCNEPVVGVTWADE